MPPSNPLAGRLRSRMAPFLAGQHEGQPAACRLGRFRCPAAAASSAMPSLRARQARHEGADDAARATRHAHPWRRDPSSPGRRSPARCCGTNVRRGGRGSPAWRRAAGVSMANSRAITRSTLPSTAERGQVEGDGADGRRGVGADCRAAPTDPSRLAGSGHHGTLATAPAQAMEIASAGRNSRGRPRPRARPSSGARAQGLRRSASRSTKRRK